MHMHMRDPLPDRWNLQNQEQPSASSARRGGHSASSGQSTALTLAVGHPQEAPRHLVRKRGMLMLSLKDGPSKVQ